MGLQQLRDLDQAERWLRRSLDLSWDDTEFSAQLWLLLGNVAYKRFRDGLTVGLLPEDLTDHLEQAEAAYRQALEGLPRDSSADLAIAHNQLTTVQIGFGRYDAAADNWMQSIAHSENAGDRLRAGAARLNLGLTLRTAGRPEDAAEAATAALRDFEALGDEENASLARQFLAKLRNDSGQKQDSP